METYKILFSDLARKEYKSIIRHIAVNLKNQTAAVHTASKILECIDDAAKNPYIYPIYFPIEPLKYEYRKIVSGNYLIFYRVDEPQKLLKVMRIIYGKRDLNRQFKIES